MGLNMNTGTRVRNLVLARLSRWRLILIGLVTFVLILYSLTPYDSTVRSALRWQSTIAAEIYRHHYPSDRWLQGQPRYPIDPDRDIGIIVKTGYGTRSRVSQVLTALGKESFNSDIIVVQDYPALANEEIQTVDGKDIPVVDIIGWMLDNKKISVKDRNQRVVKYEHLADAIEAEDWFMSDTLSKGNGWELDAMKFIPGLQYAWENMPKKKWYVMADDDTYLVKSSLALLLGHLNPSTTQYLGNPVGDFKGRFAHGGSAAVLSAATLSKLFDRNPKVVSDAYIESITATWGDKLLATTLMRLGIYLDEGYALLFNGEPPAMTRMWIDRFCLPLVSFHGLGSGNSMEEVGEAFKGMKEPVFWRQLGKIYGAADFDSFVGEPIRANMDFVGRLDEHSTTVENVGSVEECVKICGQHSSDCLAWTWDTNGRRCHFAPWTITGDHHEGLLSGINFVLAKNLESSCHSPPTPILASE